MNATNDTFWRLICSEPHFSILNSYTKCSPNCSTNWYLNDCFESLVIICPIYILISIISAYLAGIMANMTQNRWDINSNIWYKRLVVIRLISILVVFVLTLIESILNTIENTESAAFYISMTVKMIALLIHFIYILMQRKIALNNSSRQYFLIAITIVLVLLTAVNDLYTIFAKQNVNIRQMVFTINIAILWVIYAITLFPNTRLETNIEHQLIINYGDNSYEQNLNELNSGNTELKCEEDANWMSKLFLTWVSPLMTKGVERNINSHNDLFRLSKKISSQNIHNKFNTYFEYSLDSNIDGDILRKRHSILKSLFKCFGVEVFLIGLLKFGSDFLGFSGPILLNSLVLYLENGDRSNRGFYYAFGLLLSTLISSIFISLFNFYMNIVTLKIRSAIITSLYKKIFLVRADTLNSNFSTGEVLNFSNTDTDRITNFCPSLLQFISLPIQLSVTLYLLYRQLGLSFLSGVVFAIVLIPINRFICNKIGVLSSKMMEWKDKRIKLMSEVLAGIRVIKMHAWEDLFISRLNFLRKLEVKYLKGRKYLDAFCVYFWATTPVLMSSFVFATFVLMNGTLTPAKVFTSLALLGMLISPLNAFPWVLNGLMEAWISLKRLQKFFDLHQLEMNKHYNSEISESNYKFEVCGAVFSHLDLNENNEYVNSFGPIDLTLEDDMFIGIIGKVGSGKSSLLSSLLGEKIRINGNLAVNQMDKESGIALVTQEPWIQNSTIKENILFGKLFNAQRYHSVLDACALLDDIQIFPDGDMTLIGDRGVTLSGGQKSRIALARAVYQDFSIYLIDDPFASVDIHVAEQIYSKCILGLLNNKCKIVCTHHTKYLSEANLVAVMDSGQITCKDLPNIILKTYANQELYMNKNNLCGDVFNSNNFDDNSETNFKEEEREEGVVRLKVYMSYFKSVGVYLSIFILLSILLMQISRSASDVWLAYWTSSNHFNANNAVNYEYYLIVFAVIALANSVFTLIRAFVFAYGGVVAALKMHHQLLIKLFEAPVIFFDLTPFGRIINRFSTDVYNLDDALPFTLNIFLAQIYSLLASLVITIYGLPWISLLIFPVLIPYFYIQRYYRWTSRELKRISAVTLSPIYAQLDETLQGLVTIRAFASINRFMQNMYDKIDVNNKTQYATSACQQWLNLRLQLFGVLISSGVAILAVSLHIWSNQTIDPGLVGLALVYSLSVTALLNGSVQSFAQTEMDFVSVERVMQYIDNIDSEESSSLLNDSLLTNWPNEGTVVFRNVCMRYRSDLPLALDRVSFTIKSGQRIGIVGRTGSGKSSLFQTLFRLVSIEEGNIFIDDVDISQISLSTLRSNIFIIPQDPFIFSGTVRDNVDPRGQHSDLQIWHSLRECQLESFVLNIGGLEANISERGRDLSVGQRQLLCLARALLSKAKILCVDEATASIDHNTERLIHEAINKCFDSSTIMTIAHKIESVLNCDTIIVMDNSTIAEIGSPERLMHDSNSMFYKLYNL